MEKNKNKISIDANEAVARVAHATNEVIVIYPITPSSTMGRVVRRMVIARKKKYLEYNSTCCRNAK